MPRVWASIDCILYCCQANILNLFCTPRFQREVTWFGTTEEELVMGLYLTNEGYADITIIGGGCEYVAYR